MTAQQIINDIKTKTKLTYTVRKNITEVYEKLKSEFGTDENDNKMVSFWFDDTSYNVLDNQTHVPILFFLLSKINLNNPTVIQFLNNIFDTDILLRLGIIKKEGSNGIQYYHITKYSRISNKADTGDVKKIENTYPQSQN